MASRNGSTPKTVASRNASPQSKLPLKSPVIFRGISTLWTLAGVAAKDGRAVRFEDLTPIQNAALVCDQGQILWLGPEKKLPRALAKSGKAAAKEINLRRAQVLPAFVECHTHLVFAGHRAQEFEWRNTGVSYGEIAARGGGILSTMIQTRKASAAELLKIAQHRVDDFLAQGVTTIEAKSGYALNLKDEIKCLQVVQKLKGARMVSTFLGAHARPPEFKTNTDYLQYLAQEVLPRIQKLKLAERVDIFIEKGFFEQQESLDYLQTAKDLGFQIVLHADQITLSGGTELGLQLDAVSMDHLIQLDSVLTQKLAGSKATAVLLPAADLYMRCAYPPARQLIDAGARVALATDFNPGTSPTQDLQLVGLLARLEMKMTLPEVISAYTYGAAAALGRANKIGSLEVGKFADFFSMNAEIEELFLSAGRRICESTFSNGRKVY